MTDYYIGNGEVSMSRFAKANDFAESRTATIGLENNTILLCFSFTEYRNDVLLFYNFVVFTVISRSRMTNQMLTVHLMIVRCGVVLTRHISGPDHCEA